jgi:hypothetical protein
MSLSCFHIFAIALSQSPPQHYIAMRADASHHAPVTTPNGPNPCLLQVTRRIGIQLDPNCSRKAPVGVGHFSVSVAPPQAPPLTITLDPAEAAACESASPAPREYLRVYYSDFLGVAPAAGPQFADPEEKLLEVGAGVCPHCA